MELHLLFAGNWWCQYGWNYRRTEEWSGLIERSSLYKLYRSQNNDDLNDNIMFDGVDPGAVGNEVNDDMNWTSESILFRL